MILTLAILSLIAQPPSYVTTRCTGATGTAPLILYTGPAPYPLCMSIGAGLRVVIDPVTKMARLEVTPVQGPIEQPAELRQVVQSGMLSQIPVTDGMVSWTIKLPYLPAKGTLFTLMFVGSKAGTSWITSILPGVEDPMQVSMPLPSWRPLTDGDIFTIVYWTREPIVPPQP